MADTTSASSPSTSSSSTAAAPWTDSLAVGGDMDPLRLWLPYILLFLILVTLLAISFLNFHLKFRHRYARRKEGAIFAAAKTYPLPVHLPVVDGTPSSTLFALPPPGTSILPSKAMIPIPEEGSSNQSAQNVPSPSETPVIPIEPTFVPDRIANSNGIHQPLTFIRRGSSDHAPQSQSGYSSSDQRWVSVHTKPARPPQNPSSSSDAASSRRVSSKSSSSKGEKKLRMGLNLLGSKFSSR